MPDVTRDLAPAPDRSLDDLLDAAATRIAVFGPDGELLAGGAAIAHGQRFAASEALARAVNGDSPVEVELGAVRWTLTPVSGGACVLATGVDAAERERVEERLQELVGRDPLTGVLNRRSFEAELGRHMAHGRRYGMTGALIVLDVNGFRSINEEHGIRAGDRVLVEVASTLANRLRDTDVLGRIGGDQFGVLLPRARPPEAERVSQALEDAIAEEVRMGGRRVEASVGFAPFAQTMGSVEEVQLAADAAMYAVKAGLPRHSRRLRPLP
jgi:diguanylate cyclase (GGDEF)-like protein